MQVMAETRLQSRITPKLLSKKKTNKKKKTKTNMNINEHTLYAKQLSIHCMQNS